MKKQVLCLILALFTVVSMLLVSCGNNENLTASVDKSDAADGEIITVRVAFKEERTDSAIGVDYVYDDAVLELTKIEWLLEDAAVSGTDVGELAVIAFNNPKKVSGDFIKFTFKVKDGAEAGKTVLTVTTILEEDIGHLEYEADISINVG